MWDKIKNVYVAIVTKVVEVEDLLEGKTGEQKKEAVTDYIINLVDIPFVPNFIETPLKRMAVGILIDKAVEKLNFLTDYDFKNAKISTSNVNEIAAIVQEPAAPLLKALEGTPSAASLDEKLEKVKAKYAELNKPDAFAESIKFAMRWEGGKNYRRNVSGAYELINKADKGGPTNMGITMPTLLAAHASGVIDHNDIDLLSKKEAELIYKATRWDHYGFGEVAMPAALCCLDCSINHGGFAWILQRACADAGIGLSIDGKYGKETKAALVKASDADAKGLAKAIVNQRKAYYDKIVAKDESQRANLKGWYNRLRAMAEAAGVESPV